MQIHLARDGQKFGPFSLEEVRARLAAGELQLTDLAWSEGATDWVPLASFAGIGPTSPPPPLQRIAPEQPEATSGLAIASLVLGILSVSVVPLLPALPAIICGHLSLSQIKRAAGALAGRGMAIAGLTLGYLSVAFLGLIFVAIGAGIAMPVFAEVKTRGLETKSLQNAKTIAYCCKLYASDHGGSFPAKLEELVPDYLPDRSVFICPVTGPSIPIGYDYFGGQDTDPPDQVLLMSKTATRRGRRVVVRVDASGAIEKTTPPLPASSPR